MRLLVVLVLSLMAAAPAVAAGLPGGASALNETHGDWTVHCETQGDSVACALQQRQTDRTSGQQVLALDLRPAGGGLEGIIVLPFGLALGDGIGFTVDGTNPLPRLSFRTCLPQGCLVDVSFSPDVLGVLRSGTALNIETTADGGASAPFSVSLQGFANALDRAVQLLGP